jgi:hypothetical protein
METDEPSGRARPSWQRAPCPAWCTRVHLEDDHPEDRLHQDDGVVIPAILADVDPVDLRKVPFATELVVQRSQTMVGDLQVWVLIGEAETSRRLTLSLETIPRLRASLP